MKYSNKLFETGSILMRIENKKGSEELDN